MLKWDVVPAGKILIEPLRQHGLSVQLGGQAFQQRIGRGHVDADIGHVFVQAVDALKISFII